VQVLFEQRVLVTFTAAFRVAEKPHSPPLTADGNLHITDRDSKCFVDERPLAH